jgi:hypothetical protein
MEVCLMASPTLRRVVIDTETSDPSRSSRPPVAARTRRPHRRFRTNGSTGTLRASEVTVYTAFAGSPKGKKKARGAVRLTTAERKLLGHIRGDSHIDPFKGIMDCIRQQHGVRLV